MVKLKVYSTKLNNEYLNWKDNTGRATGVIGLDQQNRCIINKPAKLNESLEVDQLVTFNDGLQARGATQVDELTTSGTVSANEVQVTGSANLGTITTSGAGIIGGDLAVGGNLQINGTQTIIDTEQVLVEDTVITLNRNFTTGTPTFNTGIEALRGDSSKAQLLYDETANEWVAGEEGNLKRVIRSWNSGVAEIAGLNGFDFQYDRTSMFKSNGSNELLFAKTMRPGSDNTSDIGLTSRRVRTVYTVNVGSSSNRASNVYTNVVGMNQSASINTNSSGKLIIS
jgi:hypothetical protein